jgi:hypothetical protein
VTTTSGLDDGPNGCVVAPVAETCISSWIAACAGAAARAIAIASAAATIGTAPKARIVLHMI